MVNRTRHAPSNGQLKHQSSCCLVAARWECWLRAASSPEFSKAAGNPDCYTKYWFLFKKNTTAVK